MDNAALIDALINLPRLFYSSVSPDGRWVAWAWLGVGDNIDVYAAVTDGSQAPIRLTDTDEKSVPVSWLPDSSGLIVGQDTGGNERIGLYRVALDQPGIMTPLTDSAPEYFLHGGQLTPDGRYLVYAANLDLTSGQEIEQSAIIRHDLETGERVKLARTVKQGYVVPLLSPDGKRILYNRMDRNSAGVQLYVVNTDGSGDREVINVGDARKAWGSWLPDSERIVFTAQDESHVKVGLYDLTTEATAWLIDDPTRMIQAVEVPHVAGNTQCIVHEARSAKASASLLDPDSGLETRIPAVPGTLIPLAMAPDGRWVATVESSQQPTDLILTNLKAPNPETFVSLARVWERVGTLTAQDLTPAEDFRWKSTDEREIQGWLYRARGETARGTILYIHGGPTAHAMDQVRPEVQYYAAQGFNVLLPNYRGSTGFSLEFQDAIKLDGWGGREQDDITTASQALIDAGIAQPGRIGITGTSYGGYSSWCQITRASTDLIAAAAPICGMTDLVVDYQTTRPDLRPYSEEMMGGTPDEVPDRYYRASPINFVERIKGQLLIVQGMNDPNVTPENVHSVRKVLERNGIEHGLLAFEDEGHGIMRPANMKRLYPALAAFFADAFKA